MHIQAFLTVLVVSSDLTQTKAAEVINSCSNKVYCQGDLLDTIQRFRINQDSKTFVDMVQRNEESVTLKNFQSLMTSTNNAPTKNDVEKFLDSNFISEDEADPWKPTDFTASPAFLERIRDVSLREFAKTLVSYWNILGRRVKDTVKQNPTKHSLIPVPQGYVVPGGRFREFYYWDSYWIIKGLLISEMTQTVQGILDNFIYVIKTYGFIPNGSRIYYLNRSQPPLFTAMVGIYIESTNDITWLRNNIVYIEQELLWWLDNRTITITKNGIDYQMAHYDCASNTPRPESYAEDLTTCAHFKTEDEQKLCYRALKAGAESGWDFSTRWIFDAQGSTKANLTGIDTQRVIPVDLNSFLCQAFKLLSGFYGKLGDTKKEETWANYASIWSKNIKTLFYDEAAGIWFDFDSKLLKQRKLFYPSNFAPLWTDCFDLEKKEEYGKKAASYFYDQGIDQYLGGIPASLEQSGEQWDLPNAWPPHQEFIILGLHKTGNAEAQEIAQKFADRWISANLKAFGRSGAMYEKYDALQPGAYGGGGEYNVQIGFGWSNGVVLSFIDQFSSARISKGFINWTAYVLVFGLLPFVNIKVMF